MDELIGLLVVMTIAATIYKIVALKHKGGMDSVEFNHQLTEELADRDDRANALEERVRVLEKIVTENHKTNILSEEIDQLKEQANER